MLKELFKSNKNPDPEVLSIIKNDDDIDDKVISLMRMLGGKKPDPNSEWVQDRMANKLTKESEFEVSIQ